MSISLKELENHLSKCADIIRDAVDPTDYKEYILPLVYYKSISDEFEKQYEQNLNEYGEDFARRKNLYDVPVVPEGHSWEDVRFVSDNVDQALNEAFDALTEENPELKGIFAGTDYIEADALGDDRLGRLVEHLSKYDFDRDSVPPDMLGEAYMDLVRHFAEEEGKSGGQFFTPPHIVNLCVRLVDEFEDGMTFHDPTVGSGGMLIEAARYYREEQGGDSSKLELTGQEINPDIAAIARMNLSIHGLNGTIEREDSLASPEFTNDEDNELTRFDRVLANFPFSANWAKDELQDDPWDRFDWHEKLPRADRGDYAFIMHMAEQLKNPGRGDEQGGKAAIVIPHGVLSREDEQRYRKPMLENDLVEAIVMLPGNLFQNNSIPSALLVLNTNKPDARTDEVQFINATGEQFYEELSNQNRLTKPGIQHILSNFRNWGDEEQVSRVIGLEEIKENDYNLNISLYVDTREPERQIDVQEEMSRFEHLKKEREKLENKIIRYLNEVGYEEQTKLESFVRGAGIKKDQGESNGKIRTVDLQQLNESPVDGWELRKLGDVISLEYGDNLPSKSREAGNIPVYGSNGQVDTHSESSVDFPGIIVGRKGSIGEVEFSEEPFWPIDTTYYITENETNENLRFLYYLLQNTQLKRLNADSAIPGLNRNDAYGLNVLIPPIEEQRKISTKLLTIDKAIEKSEQVTGRTKDKRGEDDGEILIGLEAVKKGLMQDLLSGKVRTTGADIEIPDEVLQHG